MSKQKPKPPPQKKLFKAENLTSQIIILNMQPFMIHCNATKSFMGQITGLVADRKDFAKP